MLFGLFIKSIAVVIYLLFVFENYVKSLSVIMSDRLKSNSLPWIVCMSVIQSALVKAGLMGSYIATGVVINPVISDADQAIIEKGVNFQILQQVIEKIT